MRLFPCQWAPWLCARAFFLCVCGTVSYMLTYSKMVFYVTAYVSLCVVYWCGVARFPQGLCVFHRVKLLILVRLWEGKSVRRRRRRGDRTGGGSVAVWQLKGCFLSLSFFLLLFHWGQPLESLSISFSKVFMHPLSTQTKAYRVASVHRIHRHITTWHILNEQRTSSV